MKRLSFAVMIASIAALLGLRRATDREDAEAKAKVEPAYLSGSNYGRVRIDPTIGMRRGHLRLELAAILDKAAKAAQIDYVLVHSASHSGPG